MASSGWASLGNTIAGGNELPSTIAYEQGMSLGANTQDALAQARARVDQNNAKENLDKNLADSIPDPKQRAVIVQSIQAGVDPRNMTGAQLDQFKLGQQQQVADPNTSPEQTARSLLSIGQNANLTHAVGDNGNFTSELTPGQVTMSPLGAKIAGASVAKTEAETANQNSEIPLHAAQARQADALASVGGVKPPAGYAWGPSDPATGQRTLTQVQGGPADVNTPKPMGAVEARSVNRSLDAANQSVQDLGQIASLPVGANSGVLGYGSTPGKTIMDSLSSDFKNRLAPQEVQQYTVVSSGMSRALASLEAAGQIPSGSFTNSFDKLAILDGDSAGTAALKLAKQKQIMKTALESTIMDNPRVPKQFQDKAQTYLDQMDQAIPFTPQDVIKLQNKNGGMTLGQSLGVKPGAAPAAPAPAAGAPASFPNEAAAQAAGVKPGTKVVIGGVPGMWQ